MEHPICSQGDSDAHLVFRAACAKLGTPRKQTGERRSKKTLKVIQEELGWKKWNRVINAVQDLNDDSAGRIWTEEAVVVLEKGMECECETSALSSVLDTASSRGTSRTRVRGNPSPPSPPPSSASLSEGGRSTPGLVASRRDGDSSGRSSRGEAPSPGEVITGRHARRRTPEEKAARARAKRKARAGKPIEDWNANDFTDYFRDQCRRRFDNFEQHNNPPGPLSRFFAAARRGGPRGQADPEQAADNDVIKRVVDHWLETYRGDNPPWRQFLADANDLVAEERARTEQFGHGRERVDHLELLRRYGSRLDDKTEHEDG